MGQADRKTSSTIVGRQKVKENVDLFYQKISWDDLRELWIKAQKNM